MALFIIMRDEIFRNRAINRERVFRDRTNPLDYMSEGEMLEKYRFGRAGILFLCDILEEQLSRPTARSQAIPVYLQIFTALYFLACGSFQRVVSECRDIGVSKTSVCRIIRDFSNVLSGMANQFIKLPSTRQEILEQHNKFYVDHRIPNIIGLIDGTQIEIIAPTENEDVYVNRLNYHSINTQIICDFDCKIVNIVAKWPGSVHDSTILTESIIPQKMQELNDEDLKLGLLLGDSGYACTNWLLTPYRNPVDAKKKLFNSRHKSCRSKVERTIGQLKRRFPCIQHRLSLNPEKSCKVIVCCAILHNLAKEFRMPDLNPVGVFQPATLDFQGNEDTAMRDLISRQM